jgi:hypothetical protein
MVTSGICRIEDYRFSDVSQKIPLPYSGLLPFGNGFRNDYTELEVTALYLLLYFV